MALSLNPIEFWKLLTDGKKRDKGQIATWLEQAAAEARKIADIWLDRSSRQKLGPSQPRAYALLHRSYETASHVFRGRIEMSWQDAFMESAAQVLIRRNKVKRLYDKLYGKGKQIVFWTAIAVKNSLISWRRRFSY
jgi:hypothetical protein